MVMVMGMVKVIWSNMLGQLEKFDKFDQAEYSESISSVS